MGQTQWRAGIAAAAAALALLALPSTAGAFSPLSVFGTGGSGAGQFDQVSGVAVDANGVVYVGNSHAGHQVEVFNANGSFATTIGGGNGTAGAGETPDPRALALGPDGNLYVDELGAYRIDVFSTDGTFLRGFGDAVKLGDASNAGLDVCTTVTGCQAGTPGSGAGQMNNADAIAVDAAGDVFVADINNRRVDVFTEAGAFQFAFGANVGGAGVDICTGSCAAGSPSAAVSGFVDPAGVAVNGSDVFVTDNGNERVSVFSLQGAPQFVFGADVGGTGVNTCSSNCQAGTAGSAAGQLNGPAGDAIGTDGNLYVADDFNLRVDVFSPAGSFLRAFGQSVIAGDDTTNGPFDVCTAASPGCQQGGANPATPGALVNANSVTTDCLGDVYVGQNGGGLSSATTEVQRLGDDPSSPPCANVPPPGITIVAPGNGAVYTQGQAVHASYSCTPASGTSLSSCQGPVANGALIDTSALGPHTFTVSARDADGGHTTLSHTYTVLRASGLSASLTDLTPNVRVGGKLVLSAGGSHLPPGQSPKSYRFVVGGQATTCPGQFPVLNAVVTRATTATASVTITTSANQTASATTPVKIAQATLPTIKFKAADTTRARNRAAIAPASLGPIGALAYQCTTPTGPAPAPKTSPRLNTVKAAQQAPLTSNPQLPACASSLKVGIIDGLGCFEPVTDANPLPAAETKLLCGHEKRQRFVLARLAYDFCLSHPALPPAFGTPTPGGCTAFTYDSVWESTQPVSIDGLEVDPVNGARIVVARSGDSGCTAFTSPDSAYLISADAVVKVGGLPITLHVPDYTSAYNQATGAANCVQNSAGALTNGDLSGTDCLGSISIPPVSLDGKLIPQVNGPIDLSVGPSDLGIELGEFQIPNGVLPLPILPQLPLSGSIKVNLTGIGSASVAVHLQLPLLDDGMGHSLTGDTTLEIDNTNGLQVDNLDIFVPSLAELGLARLRSLEFHFKRPSYYEAGGTIDLSDVIDGLIHIHFIFDKGDFQEGDVKYFGGAGGGAPLFGPLFLTQLGATLTLHPTHIHGDTQISVGPSLTNNGCGSLGIHGTADIVFGSPWTLDATGSASVLCVDIGPSRIFHADSNGNFSYGEHLNFGIPDLGSVDVNDFGSARASISDPLKGIQPGDLLAFQGDVSGSGDFKVNLCHDFGGFVGTQCLPGSPIEVKPSITGTIALGYENSKLVGGAGVCASLSATLAGQTVGFDVGAGIDNLPIALLNLATNDLPALASDFSILADNCDVSRWRLLPPPAGFAQVHARSAGAASTQFTVASGEKVAMIGLQGRGGAPSVVLTAPNGRQIDVLRDGINIDNGVLEIRQASTGQTLIEIPKALAGKWSLKPATGSVPITMLETAHKLPAPKVSARVTGRAARRVLHYGLTPQPGLGVSFFEGVDGARRFIGVARHAHGVIRFTPALGSARKRKLFAELTRNGLPARTLVIGSYRPGRIRPGRAAHLRIGDTRAGWRISWRPGAFASSQQLTIRFIDGAEVLVTAKARQTSLILARSLDRGARPTVVAIVALRGQTRGRPAALVAHLVRRR